MNPHLPTNFKACEEAAKAILHRYDQAGHEDNVRAAMQQFLVTTELVREEDVLLESSSGSGGRFDIEVKATIIEAKTRTGYPPKVEYIEQLDSYLCDAVKNDKRRMGVLSDGRYWYLRWPDAGEVQTVKPYFFEFNDAKRWLGLYEWLKYHALPPLKNIAPTPEEIELHLSPQNARYKQDIDTLRALYNENKDLNTIAVKRNLWKKLLAAALGTEVEKDKELDELFLKHTYLSCVTGMAVQSSFGIDINSLNTKELLTGSRFNEEIGVRGVIESDFFTWLSEVEDFAWVKSLARRIAAFSWDQANYDFIKKLYEGIIPREERERLGEYYTPDWLAKEMVDTLITDPLNQKVLDPSCGSGSFLRATIDRYIKVAHSKQMGSNEILELLHNNVIGIDVHPAAVHLARATWVLAAQQVIIDAQTDTPWAVPVYLGDSLMLRGVEPDDLIDEGNIEIDISMAHIDETIVEYSKLISKYGTLKFPKTIVTEPERFDALMIDVSNAIEAGDSLESILNDNDISEDRERRTLLETFGTFQKLHDKGHDHIWAYYTRNFTRPFTLSQEQVDVIIGNPPWLPYNSSAAVIRDELKRQSKDIYDIWKGANYATHQDISGLFFSRCVDLYLKSSGKIGFVMPHSTLQSGQYSKWRIGDWKKTAINFQYLLPWDLEGLKPNDFFPMPACVVFGKKTTIGSNKKFPNQAEKWVYTEEGKIDRTGTTGTVDTSSGFLSPYGERAKQGATLVPRCFLFVNILPPSTSISAVNTTKVTSRRGPLDKVPWKYLDLSIIDGKNIENEHIWNIYLGETIAPYFSLDPLKAVLPVKHGENYIPLGEGPGSVGGINIDNLAKLMRKRWKIVSLLWEKNIPIHERKSLAEEINYFNKLGRQLQDGENQGINNQICVVYSSSGRPTATFITPPPHF